MTHFGDKVVSFFKGTTAKLEELQLQTALGKAELSDKLEEIKKDAKQNLNHYKAEVNSFVEDKKENFEHLKAKWEHLEVQLALGKAETEDELNEQKKKLSSAMHDIKNLLSKD